MIRPIRGRPSPIVPSPRPAPWAVRCPAVLVVALALVLVIDPFLARPTLALNPIRGYPAKPSHYGIVCDEVSFATSDSLSLVGWFLPAQDTSGIATDLVGTRVPIPPELRPPERSIDSIVPVKGPTIVIAGGDAGNMTFQILYAYNFIVRGFHVFLFDWRGFGESEDWPTDPDLLCYAEFLTDYQAALDHLRTRAEVDTSRIGLLGFSTGAYLSFATAAKRNDVAALACRALLTDFDDLLATISPLDPNRKWHAPVDYPPDLFPLNAAPRVRIPVFLVVGENDERTPPRMSQAVLERLGGPKELWIIPGATHGGVTGPELTNYPAFFERVSAFFRAHL